MNKLKQYTAILALGTILISCNKNDECQCYQSHEELTTVVSPAGTIVTQWVVDFQTEPSSADCASATDYVSTGSGKRFKTICN
jgi:hypothetical protein